MKTKSVIMPSQRRSSISNGRIEKAQTSKRYMLRSGRLCTISPARAAALELDANTLQAIKANVVASSLTKTSENVNIPAPVQEILNEAYEAVIEPNIAVLKAYQNGTDKIYGEILEPLIHDILNRTGLTAKSVFLDLGSGYGNVVLQAALETGCDARGIELRPEILTIAKAFQEDVERRARKAGMPHGRCTLSAGSFLQNQAVDEWIKVADVVFCNNVKWGPLTNCQLLEMLRKSMKNGAKVVFLNDWIELRTDAVTFEHEEVEYAEDSVSWTSNGGRFFIATVARGCKIETAKRGSCRARK